MSIRDRCLLIAVCVMLTSIVAHATINATSFQREVAVSFDGKRHSSHPAGDFPPPFPGESDTDTTYAGAWRASEDVVSGWDWTMPAATAPDDNSGIFTINNDAYPTGWPGKKIRVINAKWKDLEPTQGNYDFSSITDYMDPEVDTDYDGIFLNVRGFVTAIENSSGSAALAWELSAPSWLQTPVVQESLKNGYRITNLVLRDSNVKAKHLALITALKNSGILTSSRIWGQIIHMPSASRGEETPASQGDAAATELAAGSYITAWSEAAGANSKMLMWTNDRGDQPALFDAAVTNGGTGARGGAIEKWLWNAYTPGLKKYSQQTWSDGYLDVDEDGLIISQGRGWHDQNEEYYTSSGDPTNPLSQQNYRMASLRMLQMRRSILWVPDDYIMNPKMDAWMALEAGKTVTTSADAWVCLMRTWTRSSNNGAGWADREIKNFERWLYQRDVPGAMTTPVLPVDHGANLSINDNLTSDLWYVNVARVGTAVGIAVDDRFIGNTSTSVAIKVTYLDSSYNDWSLEYTKSNDTTGTRDVTGTGTNGVRTATFFLTDFKAPATGTTLDFRLLAPNGDTPFMFVRVIKL